MAALLESAPRAHSPSLVDLRYLRSEDLLPLLDEEVAVWRDGLDWDFGKSAELVVRFVDMRALNGFALVENREAVGYAYYVLEDHKGLIGDLYLRRGFAGIENENRLLEAVLQAMTGAPQVTRIESQLMMAHAGGRRPMPFSRYVSGFERDFMMLDLERASLDAPRKRTQAASRIYLERWSDHYQESAAQLIAMAYGGHVDSLINDQYRSVAGARRFLYNIVQFPGCGMFFPGASVAACERAGGRLCGISLASLVREGCGHITQICVAPWVRGAGVGYELLRFSLGALRAAGCRKTSLTVTASNRDAIKLYEDVGFETIRKFSAHVWEGF
jgi:ribosomal protein S18 acetylase RimI-like enzyme